MADDARPVTFIALAGDTRRRVQVARTSDGWTVTIDDAAPVHVDAARTGPTAWSLVVGGVATEVHVADRGTDWLVDLDGRPHRLQLLDQRTRQAQARSVDAGGREVRAVMPGKIVAVLVTVGTTVERGAPLLVIEAMKMENEITATRAGTVSTIAVRPGQPVEAGELLAVIEDA